MAEAIQEYAAAYERPGVVTGFIALWELTEGTGITCWWMTGSGATPTDINVEGLAPHRALGLLGVMTREIKKRL